MNVIIFSSSSDAKVFQ